MEATVADLPSSAAGPVQPKHRRIPENSHGDIVKSTPSHLDNPGTGYATSTRSAVAPYVGRLSTSMKFFFYADNLNPTQLKRRAPEHKFLFKAYLPDHTIQFCRWSSQWRCGLKAMCRKEPIGTCPSPSSRKKARKSSSRLMRPIRSENSNPRNTISIGS